MTVMDNYVTIISNASVTIGTAKVTDASGVVLFNDLSVGEKNLTVTKDGYVDHASTILVESGKTTEITVAMIDVSVPVTYKIYIGFSPYISKDPTVGQTVSEEEVRDLLKLVFPYINGLRTYSSTKGSEYIAKLAKARGLYVVAGCTLTGNQTNDEAEIAALIVLIQKGYVDMAIVGTETLYNNYLTEAQLISYINQVKAYGVPTTTNDTWWELYTHPSLMAACDIIIANFYPFWEKVAIEKAARNIEVNYNRLKDSAGGKEIIIGEIGWPSAGGTYGDAVASNANAAAFFLNFISWARAKNVKYYYFEAFDENFKIVKEGEYGRHWGIWDKYLVMKPDMIKVFNGETVADNWSITGPKTISMTCPAYGITADLTG